MPPSIIKLGRQSGEHGSYTFYRSFSYQSGRKWRHIKLGKFFFVRLNKNSPICIGELQLVWTGRYSSHPLTSVRLYFLPEQIPDGRQSHHGQDELVATDKMVVHAKDLIKWIICDGVEWRLGLSLMKPNEAAQNSLVSSSFQVGKSCNRCAKRCVSDGVTCNVQVIDLKSYCKLRTVVKRVANELSFLQILNCPKLSAIYDLKHIQPNKYIMFCKETFLCAELENHDFRCDHLAPNLKGRPKKKAKGKNCTHKASSSGLSCSKNLASTSSADINRRPSVEADKQKEAKRYEKVIRQILTNKEHFTKTLYKHMKDVGTPISKVPSLGFKKVDLHLFFKHVYSAGGFTEVCKKRLWKTIYDKMGGDPQNTSAPSCTKKQYERLLLSFERNIVLPGTAGKIKVHLPSQNVARRKPRLKTRLDKIKQEWSSLVNFDKGSWNPCSHAETVKDTAGNMMDDAVEQNRNECSDKALVIDENVIDEDQLPLAVFAKNKTKREFSSSFDCNKQIDVLVNTSAAICSETTISTGATTAFTMAACPHSSMDNKKDNSSFTNTLAPAHLLHKASMPLNILGPCLPDELTLAQRSPWTTKLSRVYGNPCVNNMKQSLVRGSSDKPLDLSFTKRMKINVIKKPDVTVDEFGAIDLTLHRNKSRYEPQTHNVILQPQHEPINYSGSKSAASSSKFCAWSPGLLTPQSTSQTSRTPAQTSTLLSHSINQKPVNISNMPHVGTKINKPYSPMQLANSAPLFVKPMSVSGSTHLSNNPSIFSSPVTVAKVTANNRQLQKLSTKGSHNELTRPIHHKLPKSKKLKKEIVAVVVSYSSSAPVSTSSISTPVKCTDQEETEELFPTVLNIFNEEVSDGKFSSSAPEASKDSSSSSLLNLPNFNHLLGPSNTQQQKKISAKKLFPRQPVPPAVPVARMIRQIAPSAKSVSSAAASGNLTNSIEVSKPECLSAGYSDQIMSLGHKMVTSATTSNQVSKAGHSDSTFPVALHSSFLQPSPPSLRTHQLNSPPLQPRVHAQPSLQRLPPNSSISAYHRLLSPNYTSLPALPRLQPIPSRHSSAPATSLPDKYSVNPNNT